MRHISYKITPHGICLRNGCHIACE
jgi:hypothetical protein